MPEESSNCSIAAVTRSTARRASGTASAAPPDSIMSAIAPATSRARSEYSPRPRYGCCRRSRRNPSINRLTSATPASAIYSSNRTWRWLRRKLTATGRIGLADGRQLVELLGTGDTIDPEIGGRVFKTRSSEDLAHLNRIVDWAKAARLVRVSGTKLMPVKKNAALAERPLDLVLALLEAYPRLGKSLFPRNTWRQSLVGDEFTDISQELITGLLCSAGPGLPDDFNGIASDVIEARYVLTDLTELQHDSLRRMIAADVTIAMAALHVLGVVVLDREAGSVMLTDLGRYAIRRVRGMAQPGDTVLQLRVTLADVNGPPVWRRLVVPAGYTLDRVHGVIQAAMGWQNCHLHTFRIAGREYGPAYLDDELETLDEKQFRIGDLVKAGDLAGCGYDFGDGWEHELAVEACATADRSEE